jgi:hypothetical protein
MAPPLSPNILETDVDALSPIDDTLMGAIRSNLLNLDSQITGGGSAFAPVVQFKLNGPLDQLPGGRAKRVDVAYISNAQTLSNCQLYLDQPGTSGTLEVDLRKLTTPKIPITAITPQYSAAVQSVFRAGTAMATQSITRTTEQIATQSITQWKPTLNVLSIIGLGGNLWQYNLSAAPDSDWKVGDTVTFSSCAAASNNGSFQIVRVNDYGSRSIVVSNNFGVAQAGSAGSCVLRAYSYNFVDPVSTEFVHGEKANFSAHAITNTDGNNANFKIYAVNKFGNNLIVKNKNGLEQTSPGGTVQGVTRVTETLSTQSITQWKSALDVVSIVDLGGNLWQYYLSSQPDEDWEVNDWVTFSSCTTPGNNGTFKIVRKNDNGSASIVVSNESGAAQTAATGRCVLRAYSYNFSVPASQNFVVGETAAFSGHAVSTNAGNNSKFEIYAANASGNNIIVKNPVGEEQNDPAGVVDVLRFSYNMAIPVSQADFIVGDTVTASGHSTSGNNGIFTITAINSDGNNIQVYSESGSTQGGIAGSVNSNQWVIALPTDPSSQIEPGQEVYLSGLTAAGNNGQFVVRQVKRANTNNITLENPAGSQQNSSAGTIAHTRKLVKFASDQADLFSTTSWIEIQGVPSSFYSTVASSALGHQVLEINRGGGASYNLVIKVDGAASEQASPAGWVALESRSIFSTTPKITIDSARTRAATEALTQMIPAVFSDGTLASGTRLAFYVLSVPTGGAYSIGLQVR